MKEKKIGEDGREDTHNNNIVTTGYANKHRTHHPNLEFEIQQKKKRIQFMWKWFNHFGNHRLHERKMIWKYTVNLCII